MQRIDFIHIARNPFSNSTFCVSDTALESTVHLENHNAIVGYMCCNVSTKDFEIPVSMLGSLEYLLTNMHAEQCIKLFPFDSTRYRKLISVLTVNGGPIIKKTAESIFRTLFFRNSSFYKVVTTKGVEYYGGPGIICDSNMKPLLLYTCHVKSMKLEENILSRFDNVMRAVVDKYILRVDPSVFTNKDMLSKNIISKVIPSIGWKTNAIGITNGATYSLDREPVVIVEEIKDFIYKPTPPSKPDMIDKEINCFLQTPVIAEEIIDSI